MRKLNELKGLKLVLPILILAMLATDVAGVGIARSFNVVEFVPNEELTLQYFVYNDEHKDGTVTVNLEGSLRDRARVEPGFIEYKAKDELIPFTVTITLPEKPEGDLSVVVQEISDQVSQLTATVRVVQRLQFSEKKKEEPKAEVRQPLNITEIGSKFRQVILPDQIVEFSKTTAGRTMLYASLFATLVSVIVYLSTMMKRKPEEVMEQTQQILVTDKTEEEQLNQELIAYLKAGIDTGVMEELLISRLVAAGWSREIVDRNLNFVKNNR